MPAPSIPNLLSLRGARGGGRGRGSRLGRGGHPVSSQAQHDTTIQGTDTDAAVSRLSAVEVGYLEDPYAPYFVQGQQASRRLPIINRGTYTRTTALNRLVDSFLNCGNSQEGEGSERQIISLGAGTDTRCFRLFSQKSRCCRLTYHEVDFPSISSHKRMIVQATPVLRRILPDPVPAAEGSDSASWRSTPDGDGTQYWCHGLDLRDLSKRAQQGEAASATPGVVIKGLRTAVPTLLISECCLCYLETAQAEGVIKYFTDKIPNLGLVLYEPTRPDDAFGRQMVANLAARRIRMPTLEVYKEPKDQEQRLRQAGFETVKQNTVESLWDSWVSAEEKERLDGLEGLDEVEEWQLLAAHYIIAWGWRGDGFDAWSSQG
ncbi:hypothetical protein M406DRAFT_40234 [Cryphonectria parasitica EP155]|uniref:Leucine carboxyl methyltransferase 1 n=1 Tax=Cryphonectria parasitica (strain ATCC 38755 / EP155) TaxID=660469 RepID=A0A9P4Y6V8_CRYP1|nr:uncharacterized protein M406DRAFT_40234 [Cryphonectria parasitica EP155]KAF3767818.1 hypothetical protein M406DRAFT_40234 [Cryphonectria parasitica EP155]